MDSMQITQDHWIEGVKRDVLPGGIEMNTRRFLVIHHTAGATGQSSIDFWKSPEARGACAHIVIDRDGSIIQCRPFNKTCGHAGKSKWTDPNTGIEYNGLNSCSIGIELANAGPDEPGRDAFDWAKKHVWFESGRAKHKHETTEREWEWYYDAQLQACEEVAKALAIRYNLDDVVGHDDIAPDRKIDPGPLFPMRELRRSCGIDRPLPL